MSRRDDEDYQRNPIARALTDAGYRRLQRMWVTQAQYEQHLAMAHENEAHIQRIKDRVRAMGFGKGWNA